jgi:hypothetical protein
MPTVAAVVMRRGHAFSGDAAARVVGDVGGGRDGPLRLFGCHAVMIVRAPFRRRGACLSAVYAVTCS